VPKKSSQVAVLEARVSQLTDQLAVTSLELEALSYSVAHDLRAPLRAVAGFAEILDSEHSSELSAPGVGHLARVREGAAKMSDLIGDLLEYSRVASAGLHRRPVEPKALVERITASLKAEAPERAVHVSIGVLPTCSADPALLEQVLLNLLANAWKFTGGSESASVQVGALRADPAAGSVYYVRDNGIGFDPARVEKLFGVFQRGHRAEDFPGTGIGLAIVRRVISRHGGRVWAESTPGQGSCFYFTIPDAA
jgi:light-regulated signal transduction histidine kinase (bacteriophytochrome)